MKIISPKFVYMVKAKQSAGNTTQPLKGAKE